MTTLLEIFINSFVTGVAITLGIPLGEFIKEKIKEHKQTVKEKLNYFNVKPQ